MKSGALTAKQHSTLCVFAGFSSAGRVEPYVLQYLKALRSCEIDVIFVQTTKAKPEPSQYELLESLCRGVITRPNVGYDFVSWRTGIEACDDLSSYEHLLLTNDSIVGPFFDLAPMIAKMRAEPNALWGMTDCAEKGTPHLQSYFLFMSRQIFSREYFREFWRSIVPLKAKADIIDRFEIGFSQRTAAQGIPLQALLKNAEVRRRALSKGPHFQYHHELQRSELNSTLFAWDILVSEMGFPFIKTELLRDNRFHSERVAAWRDVVGSSASVSVVAGAKAYIEACSKYKKSLSGRAAHHYRQLSGLVRDVEALDFATIRHKIAKVARRFKG